MTKTSPIIRAALYFRMSTDRQEDSIDRQRSQVVPHVERSGYTVVAEYRDSGIAGDVFAGRPGFQRLLADAKKDKYDVIVVDEMTRLSRAEVVDFVATVVHPLRAAGVRVESVAEGKMTWDDVVSLILMVVNQSKSSGESANMARRVATEMLMMAKAGRHTGHRAAYGYRTEAHLVFKKTLVPDGQKAETVRFMFRHIDEGGTLGTLQAALYERGVATTSGTPRWPRNGLMKLLRNPVYVGSYVYGRSGTGKYFRTSGAGVRAVKRGEAKHTTKPENEWTTVPDHHEAIVDRELFVRVGAKLKGNLCRKCPKLGGGDFVLSGLVVCGNCGSNMLGRTLHGRLMYSCGGAMRFGKEHCTTNSVREADILDTALGVLRSHFLNPERLAAFREEVRRQEEEERAPSAVADSKKKLAEVTARIERGVSNILLAEPSTVPILTAGLAEWRKEREALVAELQRVETTSRVEDLEEKIKRVEGYLYRLAEATGSGEKGQLRQLLREVIAKIELHFVHVRHAKIKRSRLERGVIYVRGEESAEMFTQDSRRGCR